jgi:hypothetical protein
MCGGPRVPGAHGGESTRLALVEQKKHSNAARFASVSTIVQGIFAFVTTLIGLAILPASLVGKVLVFAIAIGPLVLAMRSRMRAATARKKAAAANERAWQAAAEDVARHVKGGVTAEGLGRALGIEATDADKLLTSLTVHERTRIDVGDDAEVRYSVPAELDEPEELLREEREA